MCDGELHAADYADDILVCAVCGPVVYLGRTRAPDMAVRYAFAGDVTVREADARAFPYLAQVLGELLDAQDTQAPGDDQEHTHEL